VTLVLYWFFHEPQWFFQGFKVTGTSVCFLVKYEVEVAIFCFLFFCQIPFLTLEKALASSGHWLYYLVKGQKLHNKLHKVTTTKLSLYIGNYTGAYSSHK
jgi:hypothetical protein